MKKFLLLLFCSFIFLPSFGKLISEREAKDKANEFIHKRHLFPNKYKLAEAVKISTLTPNLYICSIDSENGFVIVSANDKGPEILGYSEHGVINKEHIPCNLKWFLNYYETNFIDAEGNNEYFATLTRSGEKNSIAALIKTQWGQGVPYNALCPVHEGDRCVTGCAATAMSQLVNYFRWPQSYTSSVPSYATTLHGITMPELPSIQFDWNNMSPASIAKLMLYCGQSVRMDYDPGASGAFSVDVPESLKDVFGYSKGATLVNRRFYTNEEWLELLYKEIEKGRPVIYFGQSPEAGGHAFLIDGYEDGMFHINWGWEGFCDGYFNMDALNPGMENGYNGSHEMVINISLPANVGDLTSPKAVIENIICDERFIERSNPGEDFPSFNVSTTVISDLNSEVDLQVGLALYNDSGFVKILSQESNHFMPGESYSFQSDILLDKNIAEGDYRIVGVNRINDSENWLTDLGSSMRYIEMKVNDQSLMLQPIPKTTEEAETIEFGVHTFGGVTYRLYSRGDNLWAEVLPFRENGKYEGDIYIPDSVTYQNMVFNITCIVERGVFSDSPDLISLSIPTSHYITNCAKLRKIELRDNIVKMFDIQQCPLLEELVYPVNCSDIVVPKNCENLKSITFKNQRTITLKSWSEDLRDKTSLSSLKDIYIEGDIPPTYRFEEPVIDINKEINVHIPKGSLKTYQNSYWKVFNLVEDRPSVPVNVQWDYCGNFSGFEEGWYGFAMGYGNNDVEFAIRMPKEQMEAYKNCKITRIEYYTVPVSSDDTHSDEDVEYVFVTSPGVDYLYKKAVKTERGRWTTIELDQPVTINGEDLFVGIGRKSVLGMPWTDYETMVEEGFWFRTMGNEINWATPGQWYIHGGEPSANHPIPLRAIIEGDKLPMDIVVHSIEVIGNKNEVVYTPEISNPKSFSQNIIDGNSDKVTEERFFHYTIDPQGNKFEAHNLVSSSLISKYELLPNQTQQLKVKVQNRSPKLVENFTFDLEIDGNKIDKINVNKVLITNQEDFVYVDIPDDLFGRSHSAVVNVVEIDGEPDEIPDNSRPNISFVTPSKTHFPRKIVMEEATGTWCGWCPRGLVGIMEMKKLYPDNFIAIAVHDDIMAPGDEYSTEFIANISVFPSCRINRSYWMDPWFFDIDDIKDAADASIKVNAEYNKEGKIDVKTESIFGFDDKCGNDYKISYVIVEDGVGPYYQSNYYSDPDADNNTDDPMNWWISQVSKVETVYNDVARAIYGYNGIDGQIPNEIHEGNIYNCDYTIPVPSNIQNPENLKVIVLLLDTKSGEIMNADITKIEGEYTIVPSITISPDSILLKKGETEQLETILYPSFLEMEVYWKSDNINVATVSENGLVTAISAGTAIITAICGDVSAECVVTVLDDSGVESLFVNPENKVSIYSPEGILIKKDCKVEDLKTLNKGIFIIVSGKEHYKISI